MVPSCTEEPAPCAEVARAAARALRANLAHVLGGIVFALRAHHVAGVAFDPAHQRFDMLGDARTHRRKAIVDVRRHHRTARAREQSVALEVAQCLREHFLGNSFDAVAQFGKSQDARDAQRRDDKRSPAPRHVRQNGTRNARAAKAVADGGEGAGARF